MCVFAGEYSNYAAATSIVECRKIDLLARRARIYFTNDVEIANANKLVAVVALVLMALNSTRAQIHCRRDSGDHHCGNEAHLC